MGDFGTDEQEKNEAPGRIVEKRFPERDPLFKDLRKISGGTNIFEGRPAFRAWTPQGNEKFNSRDL